MKARLVLWLLLAGGCAGSSQETAAGPQHPQVTCVEVPQMVRVNFEQQHGEILSFSVLNYSNLPLIVDRDAVQLVEPSGQRMQRLPGGIARQYSLPPGGVHDVKLRYPLKQVPRGEVVAVDFTHAVLLNGAPIAVPPLYVAIER